MRKYRFEVVLHEGSDEMWEEAEDSGNPEQYLQELLVSYFQDRGWDDDGKYKNLCVTSLGAIESDGQLTMKF